MVLRPFFVLLFAVLFFSISTAQKKEKLPTFQEHIVRDRETPSSIAADFNIKTKYFLMLNNFPDSVKLRPGQKVLIRQLKDDETVEKENAYYVSKPAKASSDSKASKNAAAISKESTSASSKSTSSDVLVGPNGAKYEVTGGGFHIVQKGQTFYRIALIYHLSIDELKALNNMTNTDIKVGQELKVTK